MEFAGARQALATPGQELPGKVNYIRGNDPRQWQLGLPTYERVTYHEVYPGIDVVYYGNQKQLEFDLVLRPGADPGKIRLKFAGAQKLSLGRAGELLVATAVGNLGVALPTVYQVSEGIRKPVSGGYKLLENNEVSFAVGAYDRSKALVIDPVIVYSTLLGGGTSDTDPQSIAIDGSGNAYIAGFTDASDFPTVNALQPGLHSAPDGFVTKINSTGTALVYSTYIGGTSFDQFFGIAVDSTGAAWVTGQTGSSDFPVLNPFQATLRAGVNAVVLKLNTNGSLAYSTYLGSTAFATMGSAVAVDTSSNAYVTGFTSSSTFQVTGGVVQTTSNDKNKAFVTKFSPSGAVLYSTFLGGDQVNSGNAIAVDSSGNAYVTGESRDSNFTNYLGGLARTNAGNSDAFVAKLNPTATTILYATFLGGTGEDVGNAIAVDGSGNAYVGGSTFSSDLSPTGGVLQPAYGGSGDGFLAKLNSAGSAFLFITYLGGSRNDFVQSLAVDSGGGGVYVTGGTTSSTFPTSSPFQGTIPSNTTSLFITANGGSSWTPFDTNIPAVVSDIAPSPASSSVSVVATDSGIFRTTNGGTNWTLQDSAALRSLSRSPANSNIIYGGINLNTYQSTNDGVTWTLRGSTGLLLQQVVADPVTANTVYIFSTTGGVAKSTDAAATWNPSNTGLPSGNVRAMVAASDGSLYVSLAGQGVYKSTNQAASWSPVNTGLPAGFSGSFLAVAPSNPADLYVSNGTVFKTTNGGTSWTATGSNIPDANAGFLAVSPTNPNVVYVASPDAPTVFMTTDAGASPWTPAGSGLGIAVPSKIVFDPLNASRIFVVSPVNPAGFVAKINTAGSGFIYSSFLTGSKGTSPRGIAADGAGNAFVTGNTSGGFATTTGAFQTSQLLNLPEGFVIKIADSGACSFSVSPSGTQLISGNLQTLVFTVTAGTGCAWTASSNQAFTTFPNGNSGTGTGNVSIKVDANNTGSTRSATLTIAGQSITLMQANISCTFTLSNPTPMVPASGGSLQINVTAPVGCDWAAVNNFPNAITGISGSPGSGNGTVTFTIAPNSSLTTRTLVVPIATATLTITQSIRAMGDFDGNGTPDLIWMNDNSRQVFAWYMAGPLGNQFIGATFLAPTGMTGWTLAVIADVNGDGSPDLVWQNDSTRQVFVWYMGGPLGNQFLGATFLASTGMAGWTLVGMADFNGDGSLDLVWQNDTNGQVFVWYMSGPLGNQFIGATFLAPSGMGSPGWSVVAITDLNGDGKPDLIWQNASTGGQVFAWYMGGPLGNNFLGATYLAPTGMGSPGWSVVGMADCNNDGKPDLIWQNASTRQVFVWYMGGTLDNNFLGATFLAPSGMSGWTAKFRY
jgi:hypothetical protein